MFVVVPFTLVEGLPAYQTNAKAAHSTHHSTTDTCESERFGVASCKALMHCKADHGRNGKSARNNTHLSYRADTTAEDI